jgi:hypothetical protein
MSSHRLEFTLDMSYNHHPPVSDLERERREREQQIEAVARAQIVRTAVLSMCSTRLIISPRYVRVDIAAAVHPSRRRLNHN